MPLIDFRENKLSQTLWLSIIVTVGLLVLSIIPEIRIGTFHFKKIDILADLHTDTTAIKQIATDTIPPSSTSSLIFKPSLVTPIEDFSKDHENLKYFYEALNEVRKTRVRIAFYGDSFIEGDILSAAMRDTLQKVFGGSGVGLVPLATETSGFRKSIKHTYSNWDIYSLLSVADSTTPIGISGYTYVPKVGNVATYKPGKESIQGNFKTLNVFYQNTGSANIHYSINEGEELKESLDQSGKVRELTIKHPAIRSVQFRIEPFDNTLFYGVSFEDSKGIYVDNFSMRRNSGIALSKLSPEMMKQFNNYLDYKLIILQYGLNVASDSDSTNYFWYTSRMINIIKNLKETFPNTSFILLSVSDRGVNKDGKIITMEGVLKLRDMQRRIAKKSGIAFWDLFEAMGGRNSIAGYTEAEPPMAAKDYTHLNHLGGIKVGRKFAEALLYEIKKDE